MLRETSMEKLVRLAGCSLAKTTKKDNWVENSKDGKLPEYICKIAKSLHEKRGMDISHAIATAVSKCKKWAAGGDGVHPDTAAKASAAIAKWEKMKAGTYKDG